MRLELEAEYTNNLYNHGAPGVDITSTEGITYVGVGPRFRIKDRSNSVIYVDLEIKDPSNSNNINVLTLNLNRETALAMATYIQQYYANEI